MLWDDDWAGCKVCFQNWKLIPGKGWMPIDENGNSQLETYRPPRATFKKKFKPKAKAARR